MNRLLLIVVTLMGLSGWAANGRAASAEEEIRTAVEHYFQSWSAADMKAYQACFHDDAVIFFTAKDGRLLRSMLVPFVESQRLAQSASQSPMREVPTKIQVETSEKFASALVHWELTKGGEMKRGVDVFTFVKQADGWKIGSLVFGEDD